MPGLYVSVSVQGLGKRLNDFS